MDNSSSSKSGFAGKGKYSGQKKTFGSKKTSGDKRTFGDKESFGDKKAFGDKAGYKGKRSAPVQQRQGFKPFRNKPADNSGRDRFRKPYTDERPFSKADEAGILEGRNPVMEALKSGRSINRIIISSGDREGSINKILAIAREKGIVIQEVDRSRLDTLSVTGAHQGIVAYVSPKDYVEPQVFLDKAKERGEEPFLLILDGIADPHNFGSIIRTADAVGVHGIIIPKRRAVALNATVAKASAGALEYIDVARVTNIAMAIDDLKQKGIWIAGTDSEAEKKYDEADLKGPIALVIGGEGEGIGKLISDKCDFTVSIPMVGGVSSLNASVAAAILMYEVKKQRKGTAK